MESENFCCFNCGYVFTAEEIDYKLKRAYCSVCQEWRPFPRKVINSSQEVRGAITSAIRAFYDGDFDKAKEYANETIKFSYDNLPAKFIDAFYDAYCAKLKSYENLEKFFDETLLSVESDAEEIEDLKGLFLKVKYYLEKYEEKILQYFLEGSDTSATLEFVEEFSPYLIKRRSNIDWFTKSMKDIYVELTKKGVMEKTWLMLYKGISENSDSPIFGNNFYLKTKATAFYNNYVLGVEEIFSCITNNELKTKYLSAFEKKKQLFISKLNI